MSLRHYRELKVWQAAMDLAEQCYAVTRTFPNDELFGMVSQIRRASAAIPANIAEGQGRPRTKEFLYFLGVARGSLMEVQTHLELSCRVKLLSQAQLEHLFELCDEVSRMLSGLRTALERKLQENQPTNH